jgi:DNA-directed RNA polymerase specialized sigma24 family protein
VSLADQLRERADVLDRIRLAQELWKSSTKATRGERDRFFREVLRASREHGLSTGQLAEVLGVNRSRVQAILTEAETLPPEDDEGGTT